MQCFFEIPSNIPKAMDELLKHRSMMYTNKCLKIFYPSIALGLNSMKRDYFIHSLLM